MGHPAPLVLKLGDNITIYTSEKDLMQEPAKPRFVSLWVRYVGLLILELSENGLIYEKKWGKYTF